MIAGPAKARLISACTFKRACAEGDGTRADGVREVAACMRQAVQVLEEQAAEAESDAAVARILADALPTQSEFEELHGQLAGQSGVALGGGAADDACLDPALFALTRRRHRDCETAEEVVSKARRRVEVAKAQCKAFESFGAAAVASGKRTDRAQARAEEAMQAARARHPSLTAEQRRAAKARRRQRKVADRASRQRLERVLARPTPSTVAEKRAAVTTARREQKRALVTCDAARAALQVVLSSVVSVGSGVRLAETARDPTVLLGDRRVMARFVWGERRREAREAREHEEERGERGATGADGAGIL